MQVVYAVVSIYTCALVCLHFWWWWADCQLSFPLRLPALCWARQWQAGRTECVFNIAAWHYLSLTISVSMLTGHTLHTRCLRHASNMCVKCCCCVTSARVSPNATCMWFLAKIYLKTTYRQSYGHYTSVLMSVYVENVTDMKSRVSFFLLFFTPSCSAVLFPAAYSKYRHTCVLTFNMKKT